MEARIRSAGNKKQINSRVVCLRSFASRWEGRVTDANSPRYSRENRLSGCGGRSTCHRVHAWPISADREINMKSCSLIYDWRTARLLIYDACHRKASALFSIWHGAAAPGPFPLPPPWNRQSLMGQFRTFSFEFIRFLPPSHSSGDFMLELREIYFEHRKMEFARDVYTVSVYSIPSYSEDWSYRRVEWILFRSLPKSLKNSTGQYLLRNTLRNFFHRATEDWNFWLAKVGVRSYFALIPIDL